MRTCKIVWILVWNNQELYTHVIVYDIPGNKVTKTFSN